MMATESKAPIAVISGDLVDSTALNRDEYERVLAQIKTIQAHISQAHCANQHSIIRGDEFQSVIHDVANALHYVVMYRVAIKALGKPFDCRISFAIAEQADLREAVSESMGQAFVLSGRGLKAMKNQRLAFFCANTDLEDRFALLIHYLDRQLSDATSRQCEMMLPLLQRDQSLAYGELAAALGVANATVSKSLKAAGWELIEALLAEFQQAVGAHV
jgi:hypothetical protein